MVASVPPSPVPAVITLLGRPGCHLCDDAREVISRVAADLGVAWEERDITASERDLRDYSDMIPVTLINGVQHDFWHVSEQRLRAALAAAARRARPERLARGSDPREPPGRRWRRAGRARQAPSRGRSRGLPTLCMRSQGRTVK